MLTEKDYCDYETCVALKELGYDELCEGYYHLTDDEEYDQLSFDWCYGRDFQNSLNRWRVGVPMLYEAQKWLREEKSVIIVVCPYSYNLLHEINTWTYEFWLGDNLEGQANNFDCYEEALSEGIKEAVKFLKGEVR